MQPQQFPHFFVTTLGDAQHINSHHPHHISTISELLIRRAGNSPDAVAVGMGIPPETGGGEGKWRTVVYTYSQLLKAITAAAHRLSAYLPPALEVDRTGNGPTVAILSESSWDMLLCFLGLIRMGYTVLLIAPQCDVRSVRFLLESTSTMLLLYSPHLSTIAFSSSSLACSHRALPTSEDGDIYFPHSWWPTPSFINSSSVAYFHHTSGTTSGLPKPVPQVHAAATVHLPCLPPKKPVATLTTTPLYHGGIADFFRSMMSCSMIWLFPPSVPITAQNIVRAISTADELLPEAPVRLFTGVPYIQNMCLESEESLRVLRNMDIVGYGGAQLAESIGNALVDNGVNLVSRFGSTECGFLMSSYRDFSTDKAWDYLRVPSNPKNILFERQNDGTRELVVLPGWPHMAKRNRADGSYATSDLFTPHPTIPRAYRYATRNDSTIVLTNGKKFDPMPIEDALKKLETIEEAIVFGQNKEFPGVLLFPSHKHSLHTNTADEVNNVLEMVNQKLPSYGRIAPEMVLLLDRGRAWPKSSKGTALRNAAESVFASEIEHARQRYENLDSSEKVGTQDGEVLQQLVARIVHQVVGKELTLEEDFFMAGVDSIMATTIRRMVLKAVDVKIPLPMNAIFEQRNIRRLARHLSTDHVVGNERDHELTVMREMVYRSKKLGAEKDTPNIQVVLLTGATGALGAHILHALIEAKIKKVICLCRAESAPAATARILDSLKRRNLPMTWDAATTAVQACPTELSETYLGVPKETYSQLATEGTMIVHAAWPVNFLAPLPSFGAALAGTHNLLELAHTGTLKRFIFCSSTASVIRSPPPIREEPSNNPQDASPLGYSRSKWVAEGVVRRAGGEVVRLGQLSGDTKAGIWNAEEGWPLLLKTLKQVGCLPELKEVVHWLPVDIASQAIVKIALERETPRTGVWHITNKRGLDWERILDALETWYGEFEKVTPSDWVRALELKEEEGEVVKLLGLWKDMYGSNPAPTELKEPEFEVKNYGRVYPGFAEGIELDQAYLGRIFEALGIERKEPTHSN